MTTRRGDLRVVHTQDLLPGYPFVVYVTSVPEALLIVGTLIRYDIFQWNHKLKDDFYSRTRLEAFNGREWNEWVAHDGTTIHDYVIVNGAMVLANNVYRGE